MLVAQLGSVSEFWEANDRWLSALASVAFALGLAFLLNRALSRRGRTIAQAVMRGELSPEADTRLRFVRRLAYATIIGLGVALALSQFTGINRLAASLLASGAIAAAVVGFAARQTLANLVAGIMLAITQPIRVGDWVWFEDQYGVVEDVRLNYTFLRTPGDQRVIIPNEKLASGILRNDTLGSASVELDVQVWLPPGADVARAIEALQDETGQEVTVAEAVPWGVRLAVGGEPSPPPERGAREAALRLQAVRRLQAEGLLSPSDEVGSKGFST
ncbi:MAG TPA: mechanosensitive ion channel domain-containing protein [Solirubrobacteraceae bacterium]|nr:mechanosensitive ion channel domain-containing protein [Solirubrobacteraceae bacterium]